jgi:hypothetical protein
MGGAMLSLRDARIVSDEVQRMQDQREAEARRAYLWSLLNRHEDALEDTAVPKENPDANFFAAKPYRFEALSPAEKASYQKQMQNAMIAISEENSQKFNLSFRPSSIPARTRYTQETHQRRWKWLDASRKLFFVRRAEYLFNWYRYKSFFDAQVQQVKYFLSVFENKIDKHKHLQKIEKMQEYIRLYTKIIKEHSTPEGILKVDSYVASMTGEEQLRLKTIYEYLDRARLYIISKHVPGNFRETDYDLNQQRLSNFSKDEATRTLDAAHLQELKTIMQTQLKLIPNAALEKHADILKQLVSKEITSTTAAASDYPAELARIYQNTLQMPEAFYQELMRWVGQNIVRDADIAEISDKLIIKVNEYLSPCQKLAAEQNTAEEELTKTLSLLAPPTLDIPLVELQPLLPAEDEPLLHLAMCDYACASSHSEKKADAFTRVFMLIARGCSPYAENQDLLNAFEYANQAAGHAHWPEWELYLCILNAMTTQSPFAEMLRVELVSYCETSIADLDGCAWFLFHSTDLKAMRQIQTADLIRELYKAGQDFNDRNLLVEIRETADILGVSLLEGSKLLVLLRKVLSAINANGLILLDKPAANNNLINQLSFSS